MPDQEKRFHFEKDGVEGFVTTGGDGPAVRKLEAQLRPKWSETAEDVRQAADVLTSFTRDAYRVQVAQREEDLKAMIRRAIELVEENPRNEPMRAEISRPAVERMLAEDLVMTGLPEDERQEMAKELFDAGWRPTIDRLVR